MIFALLLACTGPTTLTAADNAPVGAAADDTAAESAGEEDTAAAEGEDTEDTGAEGEDTGSGGGEASRCEETAWSLTCDHQTTTVYTGYTGLLPREVHWQVPLGTPPEDGWPTVLLFQGSLFTAELFWTALDVDTFGYWNQGMLTKRLLDAGFAVITPEAHLEGATAWETNIPPMSYLWEISEDHQFMLDIFSGIEGGTFGALDAGRLYAAGISSGGYMSSRMGDAYRERFSALAIHSASWATCAGVLCDVPDDLDSGHLPTLFLHGSDDLIVPVSTMTPYHDALVGLGVDTEAIVIEGVGHAWTDEAPAAIVAWFSEH